MQSMKGYANVKKGAGDSFRDLLIKREHFSQIFSLYICLSELRSIL